MKNKITNRATLKIDESLSKIGLFFEKYKALTYVALFALTFSLTVVFADSADANWNAIMDFMKKWVGRGGGVVMFVGLITFGLGFKTEDAQQKTMGIYTIVAGAIAIGATTVLTLTA